MKWAMLVVSEVTTTVLPSGLDADAFRLDADLHLGQHLLVGDVDHGEQVVVLVGDIERVDPKDEDSAIQDRGLRAGRRQVRRLATSSICTVSSSLAQISRYLSSLVSLMPRGRWPTGIVSVTSSVALSSTVIEFPFSLET